MRVVRKKIEEASKDKLLRYITHAVSDYGNKRVSYEKELVAGQGVKAHRTMIKGLDRQSAIRTAAQKIAGKKVKVKATNEAVGILAKRVRYTKAPSTTTGAQGTDFTAPSAKKTVLARIHKYTKAPTTTKGAQGVAEEVDIAVRSFYAKHYAKNYGRFLRKNPAGQSIKKAQHSAYGHVSNKYGSEIEKQLRQFHTSNAMSEDTINELTKKVLNSYISKSKKDSSKLSKQSLDAHQKEPWSGAKLADKVIKRQSGIATAARKTQLAEMTDTKIRQYIGKALGDTKRKRTKSINLAADKIEKKAKVPATLEENRNKPIPDHPYHSKTDAELKYIQKDAHEAAKNMRGHDAKAEEKYLDQVNDASTVLYYRKQHGKDKDEPKKLDEALKLVKTYEIGPHAAKVYKDNEWNEHRVKFFTDGKHHEKADYHTSDKEDAHDTAQSWLNKQEDKRVSFISRKEGFQKKKLNEAAKVIGSHTTASGNKYELVDNGSWHAIRKTHQNGESVQNEWGGYNSLHVGTPKYIAKKWATLKASQAHAIKPFEKKKDDLTEARIKIIKARIRGGKIQRRKKVATQPGWTLRGGKLKRMSAAERRKRKLGQRRGKIKRRTKLSRTLVKRKRSLIKRQRLHLG